MSSKHFNSEPLVSVVTPVHNGAQHIEATICSVLAQTHKNLEYVVVDNASTDATADIALRYAAADQRIRVVKRDRLLEIMDNWNSALAEISPDSEYVKIVHADDLLYPRCLEVMVEAAQVDPRIGIVSAYRAEGDRVTIHGVDAEQGLIDGTLTTRIPGKEAVAKVLHREAALFGSPSALLIRGDVIRRRQEFYDTNMLHADTDACMRELMECDLAFVHEVLTYTRRHEASLSSLVARLGTQKIERLVMLQRYGAKCMEAEEFASRWRGAVEMQQRFVVRGMLEGRGSVFRDYQLTALSALGLRPSRIEMLRNLLRTARNPSRLLGDLSARKSWRGQPSPDDVSAFLKWTEAGQTEKQQSAG